MCRLPVRSTHTQVQVWLLVFVMFRLLVWSASGTRRSHFCSSLGLFLLPACMMPKYCCPNSLMKEPRMCGAHHVSKEEFCRSTGVTFVLSWALTTAHPQHQQHQTRPDSTSNALTSPQHQQHEQRNHISATPATRATQATLSHLRNHSSATEPRGAPGSSYRRDFGGPAAWLAADVPVRALTMLSASDSDTMSSPS